MTVEINLDLETFSGEDLKAVGLYKYARSPDAEIMISQYSIGAGPVILEDWVSIESGRYLQTAPDCELVRLLRDPSVIIRAFNASFERLMLQEVWGISLPPSRFRCTMVKAFSMGFFGGMAQVGEQMGLAQDLLKQDGGMALIRRFCQFTPKNHNVRRYTKDTHPAEWAKFLGYAEQDVIAERSISNLLKPYEALPREVALYNLDQKINDHGVLIDMEAAYGAVVIDAEEKQYLKDEAIELTGLANPNSRDQLLGWLTAQGHSLPNLQAQTVKDTIQVLESNTLPDETSTKVCTALKLKTKMGKTSVSKYKKFLVVADHRDHRFRGALQFNGAQRTARWAARLVQLHNLARPLIKAPEQKAWLLQLADRQMVSDLHGDVTDFLVSCIRCVIVAPPGMKLVRSDFASVESRYVAWMSGCVRMNELFRDDKDSYKDFASVFFNIDYEDVTKEQRTWAKPPVLGCAYQLGAGNEKTGEGGLMTYAKDRGTVITYEESKAAVSTFRSMHPEIVQMWYWLVEACTDVINHGAVREGYTVKIFRDNNFLFIQLPSGRKIPYFKPRIEMTIPPWEMDLEPIPTEVENPVTGRTETIMVKPKPKLKATITYMGKSKEGNKWVRLTTHGGKITENICQAGCRDLLGDAMLDLDQETPHPLCLHVHDEPMQEVAEADAEEHLVRMNDILCRSREWAPGLFISAEGEITDRFTK